MEVGIPNKLTGAFKFAIPTPSVIYLTSIAALSNIVSLTACAAYLNLSRSMAWQAEYSGQLIQINKSFPPSRQNDQLEMKRITSYSVFQIYSFQIRVAFESCDQQILILKALEIDVFHFFSYWAFMPYQRNRGSSLYSQRAW